MAFSHDNVLWSTVKPPLIASLFIIFPWVLCIYCGPYKPDTSKTLPTTVTFLWLSLSSTVPSETMDRSFNILPLHMISLVIQWSSELWYCTVVSSMSTLKHTDIHILTKVFQHYNTVVAWQLYSCSASVVWHICKTAKNSYWLLHVRPTAGNN